MLMATHLITAFFGAQWWNDVIIEVAGIPLQRKMFPILFQIIGAYVTLSGNVITLALHVKKEKLNALKVYSHLIPVLSAGLFATSWAYYSPSDLVHNQSVAYAVAIGFLFANLVGKIVLARVCKEVFSASQPLLIAPLALGLINALLKEALFPEALYVKLYLGFCILCHLHFALTVINLLCQHLQIYCLRIKKKSTQ